MKLSFVLCFATLFQALAVGYSQTAKVSLSLYDVKIEDVLDKIEEQSEFYFLYNQKLVDLTKKVNVEVSGKTIHEVLTALFDKNKIDFVVYDRQIIVSPAGMIDAIENTVQQGITITGTVTDMAGEPLPGVNILVKGTISGVVSDIYGKYTITVANPGTVLQYSFVGYTTQELTVGEQRVLNITLAEDVMELDEVVVVGYGTQRKKDLTGGISTINAGNLEKIPATSITKKLQGQVAGLNITVSPVPGGTTTDGKGSTIRIRGEKSLSGGNDPLIVLDGIPYSGGLNQLDQSSIENITVLKDASSAAIYGARAANGVILVTSKKGKQGQAQVRYSGYVAVQTPERLFNMQSGAESIELLKQYFRDMGSAESVWTDPTQFLPSLPKENYLAGKEFDWQDDLFNPAFQQEHQLSLSGATDQTSYYASLTYTDQDGIIKNTDYQKIAATINMSQKIGKWLTVGTNTQLSQRQLGNGKASPSASQAFYLSPWSNPYDENGKYNRYPMYTTTYWTNPYADDGATYDNKLNTIFTGWYADITLPVEGLSYRTHFGYTYQATNTGSYYGKSTLTGQADNGVADVYNNTYADWTWENVLKYDRSFGKHQLNLTGLISAQKTANENFSAKGKNFLNDGNTYHNIDAAQGEKTIASDRTETALASYMGRLNYGYASKYLLTITARYDGYSAFGPNNKWAFFPSVAGGWVASEEEFFKNWNISDINYLKFRLSYGANGNQAVTAYRTMTKLSQLDYIYGDGSLFAGGLYSGFEVGNPNLRWETTYSLNGGLDFGFFRNRLAGSLEVYSANTHDLLMSRTVPVMNGYTTMMDNIGKTNTKGFEITLNTVNIRKNDFEWNTALIGSGNWNSITALREDGKDDVGNAWFIGEPIRVFYDYKVIGTWQNDEKDRAAVFGAKPGDAKLLDKNPNDKVDADDRTIIGSKLPVWTAGLTNTFTYKNFTLSFFLNGVFDITKENSSLNFLGRQFDKCTNFMTGINYWTPENGSNEATRLGYNPKNSHKFYSDASFVRLQDITLAYDLPQDFIKRLSLQKVGMYINITNVYTFSGVNKYGINPENDVIGSPSTYPVPRTFVFGLNVTF